MEIGSRDGKYPVNFTELFGTQLILTMMKISLWDLNKFDSAVLKTLYKKIMSVMGSYKQNSLIIIELDDDI